jgi:hypothetical protein
MLLQQVNVCLASGLLWAAGLQAEVLQLPVANSVWVVFAFLNVKSFPATSVAKQHTKQQVNL